MKNLCTFYIVRHGETAWNVEGKMQGQIDIPLNEKGQIQAGDVAKKLHKVHFDEVFSSDLLRAKQTAEIIMLSRKIAVKTTKLLWERSFGRHEGKSYEVYNRDLKEAIKKYQKLSEHERYKFRMDKGIETDEELLTRALTFIRETAVAYLGKTILVTTHGALMRYLLVHLGFGTHEELRWGAIKNTAYFKLISDGVDFFIKESFGIEKKKIIS